MNSNAHSSYLPSKKIIPLVIIVIAVITAVIGVPRWKAYRDAKRVSDMMQTIPMVSSFDSTNPTLRDTDHDGVKDWQEIALGLDPTKTESIQGVSDTILYNAANNQSTGDSIKEFNDISDTDKISYTIFEKIKATANTTGSLNDNTIGTVTADELRSYIISLALPDHYARAQLKIVPSNPSNDATYKAAVDKIGAVDWFDPKNQQALKNYLATGDGASIVRAQAMNAQTIVRRYVEIATPDAIADNQLIMLNALDHTAELVLSFDPADSDILKKMAQDILIRTYEWSMVTSAAAILEHYGDPSAAIIRAALNSVSS